MTSKALSRTLERIAYRATVWTGSSGAFMAALALTLGWLVSGPLFHFSDTWQLMMNTVSSIVTFLMVFLIQRSQNKDALAMQVKLNEIVAASEGASNHLINIESLSEDQLRKVHEHYERLAARHRGENGHPAIGLLASERAQTAVPPATSELSTAD